MLSRLGLLLALCVAGSLLVSDAAGQDDQPKISITPRKHLIAERSSYANLRLDLKLVLIPVSVTDAMDRPITTLSRDRFRLLEDGVEQSISSFTQEETPVSLGLLFDSSGSMKNRLDVSVESMNLLFQTTMPGDEFFLVQFSDRAQLLSGFTPQPEEIQSKLGVVEAKGWTALLDAMALGVHEMRHAKNSRRVLLILSDGNDNNSRFSESEIRSMVVEGDLRVYGIGLLHRPRLLQQLAEETGGKVLIAQNLSELPDVVQRLSRDIRSQYLIGYSSSAVRNDGKYHKVKIEVSAPAGTPPLRTSWRRGYYAPGE